jgi:hypothetical protein
LGTKPARRVSGPGQEGGSADARRRHLGERLMHRMDRAVFSAEAEAAQKFGEQAWGEVVGEDPFGKEMLNPWRKGGAGSLTRMN